MSENVPISYRIAMNILNASFLGHTQEKSFSDTFQKWKAYDRTVFVLINRIQFGSWIKRETVTTIIFLSKESENAFPEWRENAMVAIATHLLSESCVSRHNGGTSGAPLMPRDSVSRTANGGFRRECFISVAYKKQAFALEVLSICGNFIRPR